MKNNHPSITDWVAHATHALKRVDIASAQLDAELILAHTLRHPRTWIHAHGDDTIDATELSIADARLALRLDHVPIAYIVGHKEFYGRRFDVSPATLIPRPESEMMISAVNRRIQPTHHTLLDVGTGSGCLGITVKLEHPALDVTICDVSKPALEMATLNAKKLGASITHLHSDLLENVVGNFDFIIANLPYVDRLWKTSPDVLHEPSLALYADDGGLMLIKKLLTQATLHLSNNGYLLLESDPTQHGEIIAFAEEIGYRLDGIEDYIIAFSYVSR